MKKLVAIFITVVLCSSCITRTHEKSIKDVRVCLTHVKGYLDGSKPMPKEAIQIQVDQAIDTCDECLTDKYFNRPVFSSEESTEQEHLNKIMESTPLTYIRSLYAQRDEINMKIKILMLASQNKKIEINEVK